MELRHVRYFLAVAEERNFTRAATKLGIGQPPLSQQIKDLEAEIGAPLFHRSSQGADLTLAGEAFLDAVRGMPAQAQRSIQAARRAFRGEIGSLRVGFLASAAFNAPLQSAIRAFRRTYDGIELRLEEADTVRLLAGLRDGSLDVAFLRPGPLGADELVFHAFSEERMIVALPSDYPAGPHEEMDLASLQSDPILLLPRAVSSTLYDAVIAACRRAGFEPTIGQLVPQFTTMVSLVAVKFGVSILPASISQWHNPGVVYRSLAGDALMAPLMLVHRKGEASPAVRNFIELAMRPGEHPERARPGAQSPREPSFVE